MAWIEISSVFDAKQKYCASKLASDASDNIVSVGNRRVRIYEKLKIIKLINLRIAVIIIIF